MRPIYLLIASSVLVLDQLTKRLVLSRFSPDTVVPVIPGFFSLVRSENRGIAFGIFSELSSNIAFGLIVLVSAGALALLCYLLWKSDPGARRTAIAFSLILGGAAGNLIDRVVRGSVVDFLDFYVRSYHWYTFNFADSAIVAGAGLLLLDLFSREQGIGKGGGNTEQRTEKTDVESGPASGFRPVTRNNAG